MGYIVCAVILALNEVLTPISLDKHKTGRKLWFCGGLVTIICFVATLIISAKGVEQKVDVEGVNETVAEKTELVVDLENCNFSNNQDVLASHNSN